MHALGWAHASSIEAQQLIDLIARLLTYDPNERPTARQALCHPFLAPVFPFAAAVRTALRSVEHRAAADSSEETKPHVNAGMEQGAIDANASPTRARDAHAHAAPGSGARDGGSSQKRKLSGAGVANGRSPAGAQRKAK